MFHDKWLASVKFMVISMFFVLCAEVAMLPRFRRSSLAKPGNYFQPSHGKPVALRLSSSAHYQLAKTNISTAEFTSLLPSGGHTVYVDDERGRPEVYTVTLFHQLKCLDIMRIYYVTDKPAFQPLPVEVRHCLNYLKQTIICRPSLGLESIQTPEGHAVRSYEAVCNDWSGIYEEAERNHKSHQVQKHSKALK